MNDLLGHWEQAAIGNENGEIELVYPEKGTWFGFVSPAVTPLLKNSPNVVIETVPLSKLDDYLGDMSHSNILIKIDVEGFEREVIQGALCLLNL
jgi:FkbM family methyltransferase